MFQSLIPAIPSWVPVEEMAVSVALVFSLAVVFGTSDRTGPLLARLRRRFVVGVPWGTVLTIGLVVCVYLFLQGGLEHPRDPLVLPFRSWSYFYPLGMLTAAFSHGSLSHITGNLVATAMFGPVAEYVWGHYPRKRGSHAFSSPLRNPYVRILVVPAVVFVVGLFSSFFALGAVIGFSGVVFAIAGFAIVQRPLLGLLALLGNRVLSLVVSAIQNPQTVALPKPRVITPWWANVAIQGHAIGILAGGLLGFALAYSRDRWSDGPRLWFGLVAFASFQGLWAFYLPRSGGRYILFRWVGTAVVFLLAAIAVLALTGEYQFAHRQLLADTSVGMNSVFDSLVRTTALLAIIVLTIGLSGVAVPYNAAPVNQAETPEPTVEVRDYSVGYAEDIPDGYVGSVQLPVATAQTDINTSGVIIASDRRHVWHTVVLEAELANRGRAVVDVGGVGWRKQVVVNRTGWKPTGNQSVYKVYLRPRGEASTLGYTSEPRRAEPVIGGRNVTLRPTDEGFEFTVSRQGQAIGRTPVPASGNNVTAGGITFVRNESRVLARLNETRLTIATRSERNNR
ncbi:rhomboid family intramembrane serine protease [Halobacteriales archaeon QS_4_62_28]|nr:MAG: rhomboid family intramembrane serine protease [Halobacteriales archaeon QS_4_62_28]